MDCSQVLNLTNRQMAAGEAGWQSERDAAIAAYLCAEYPKVCTGPAPLLDPVAQARQFALDLGFSEDAHVRDVVEACFLFGPAIGTHATFQRIIRKPIWNAADKAHAIWHMVILPRREEMV
jgi:hypothetical protein